MNNFLKGKAGIAVFSLHLLVVGLVIGTGASGRAQGAASGATPQMGAATTQAPTHSLRDMVEQRERELTGTSTRQALDTSPQLLPSLLGLDDHQIRRLDDLYGGFARRRVDQEAMIGRWHDELQRAQAPATFDQKKASGLLQSIRAAQDDITNSFLRTRGDALKSLNPVQRTRLQELATLSQSSAPTARNGQNDVYRQLLLMPVEELLQTPVDVEVGRRLLAQRANNRSYDGYGSYGGINVFGSFGHRRSGFGIGLGGILGGFGRHRGFGRHGGFGY
jgi:hypothetical protein